MTDTRFTTVVDGAEQLLNVVDIDDIGDVETLLIDATPLDLVIQENEEAVGSAFDLLLSSIELVCSCAHTADDPGQGVDAAKAGDNSHVAALVDRELGTVLQGALGRIRLSNIMNDRAMPE